MHDAFIEAAQQAGYPYNPDFNGAEQEGVGPLQLTVRGRRRCSTAAGYLKPVMHRPNLRVEMRALTHRVMLEGKRAVGVEYRQNGACIWRGRSARCCCAAARSTRRRSCNCPASDRARCCKGSALEVLHDLPGVGENLQDHVGGRMIFRCQGVVTINEVYHNWLRRHLVAGCSTRSSPTVR